MPEYSFNPQFANLTGLQPLPAIDVTRGDALQFQPLQAIEVASSRPELIGQSIAGAVSNIAQGALSGITAKWQEQKEFEKEQRKYAHELEIYGAKKASENEDFYQKQRAAFIAENSQKVDFPERLSKFDAAYSGFTSRVPETQKKEDTSTEKKPFPKKNYIVEPESLPVDFESLVDEVPQEPQKLGVFSFNFTPRKRTPENDKPLESITPQVVTKSEDNFPAPDLSRFKAPAQPADPNAPRVVPLEGFTDEAKANTIANLINQTSNISKVEVKYKPDKAGYYIVPKISEDVSPIDQEKLRIAQEDLKIKQADEARKVDAAVSDKLAKDDAYLAKVKNAIDLNAPTLQDIDQTISILEKYKEAYIPITGIKSDYIRQGGFLKPFSLLGYDAPKDAALVDAKLKQFQSKARWEGLLVLKSMSPTGSAGTGSFSNIEGDSMERLQGSLDPLQMEPEEIADRLYYIRNGAIKATMNAYRKIKKVDPSYEKPFAPSLVVNPKIQNEYNQIQDQLTKADDEFKKTQEYRDLIQRKNILGDEISKIEDANKLFFPERFDKKTLIDEKNKLINKIESATEEYKNSNEYKEDLERAKELLRLIK